MLEDRSCSPSRARFVLALAACSLLLVACSAPPMLSKADLDSGKMSKKHPKLNEQQVQAGCRSCHRERPEAAPAK